MHLTCTHDIFEATEEEFSLIFPGRGQDIEFASDFVERIGEEYEELISRIFERRVSKPDVVGMHGILFYNFDYKKEMYPDKTRADMDVSLATARGSEPGDHLPRQEVLNRRSISLDCYPRRVHLV